MFPYYRPGDDLSIGELNELARGVSRSQSALGMTGGTRIRTEEGDSTSVEADHSFLIRLTAVNTTPGLSECTPAYSWEKVERSGCSYITTADGVTGTFETFPAYPQNGSATIVLNSVVRAWVSGDGKALEFAASGENSVSYAKVSVRYFHDTTLQAAVFTTEHEDTNGFFDPAANDRFTIPAGFAGVYTIGQYVRWESTNVGGAIPDFPISPSQQFSIDILRGAGEVVASDMRTMAVHQGNSYLFEVTQTINTTIRFSVSDTIKARQYQNVDATLGCNVIFWLARLGS